MQKSFWLMFGLCLLGVAFNASTTLAQQETLAPVDENGHIVSFQRDIAPIFAKRCLECHSGDKAKADFLVHDRDAVLGLVTPDDPDSSSLYTDYLITTDPDMLMPPASHEGPLPAAELALVKLWIAEGAQWPEDAVVGSSEQAPATQPSEPVATSDSLLARVWDFQGYFHPATVHFPVALLTVGGLFVVISVLVPKIGNQIPLVCLILGSMSAVVACIMGWSFADVSGYPSYKAGWGQEVNAHRWSGIIMATAGVVLSVIAIANIRRDSRAMAFMWKAGLLGLAGIVGLVGHQGGELTYGKEFYPKAFERLLGKPIVDETAKIEEPKRADETSN